jgi:pimeloyl-ACP methyl ester carboxylesterase
MATVRTNDIETFYVRRGDGPPVVFLHGAMVDHRQWAPQVDALADAYTTVAYDLRGHGRTGGSARGSYSMGLFADDLGALLDALALERPVLCGLSTGGCVAQVYAARHPDRVAGLVLADTFTAARLDWRDRLQFALMRAVVPAVGVVGYERVERAVVRIQEAVQSGAAGDYGNVERLHSEGPRMDATEVRKVLGALVAFPRATLDLTTIAAPTLVLYGENDAGFIRRHCRALGAAIPDAAVRVVPDAGHVSNLDAPEFVTATLREFLDSRVDPDAEAASVADPE